MEDNRFKEVKRLKKKHLPHQLHWFLGEEYFSEELFGFTRIEIDQYKNLSSDTFRLFERATQHIIDNQALASIGIPQSFQQVIQHTWEQREKHPFLLGRFDINGGIGLEKGKIIEFNADTMSSLPETILWQKIQLDELGRGFTQFNELEQQLESSLKRICQTIDKEKPLLMGTSFGYIEDKLNIDVMLNTAHSAGFSTAHVDMEQVIFSEEGVFYEIGDEYQQVDVWYKMVPWDWMFNEEPELAELLSQLILNGLVKVLNPPYTTIWQNKKFLAYITEHFPNDLVAETYTSESPYLKGYVKKPMYGRIGENIQIKDQQGKLESSEGDFGNQEVVYQQYYPLPMDKEKYYYQIGMFYCDAPAALNLRCQEVKIVTDDCEFMSHFIQQSF